MKKRFISSFVEAKFLIARCLTLLILALLSTNLAWGAVQTTATATNGKSYVIAVNSGEKYYALPLITNATTYSGTEITLNANGKVTAVEGLPIWTLTENSSTSGQFYITYGNNNTTYYLYKNGTSDSNYNIKGSSSTNEKNYWNFIKTSDGKAYNIIAINRGTNHTYLNYYSSKFQVRGTSASTTNNNNTSMILLEVEEDSRVLKTLSVSGTPDKTTYEAGEEFDPAGLTVTGTYDTGDPEEITSGITWEVTPSGALTVGTTSVKVKATVGEITSPEYEVTGLTVKARTPYSFGFETNTSFDWDFTNMESQKTHSEVKAHGGSYFGTTGGKETASMTTKSAVAKPGTLKCYVSKQSTNTASSTWKIQVSSDDKATWTDVKSQDAKSMDRGVWVEFTADLSSYKDVYVRIYYSGSTAERCIDDVSLTLAKDIKSIEVKTAPTKMTYNAKETFDPTGMVITATYDDESTKDITYDANDDKWSFSPNLETLLKGTDTKVTVTYGGKTAEQAITVTRLSAGLAVASETKDVVVYATPDISEWYSVAEGYDGIVSVVSSNPDVFDVEDATGLAYAAGTATLTITTPQTDYYAEDSKTIVVTVSAEAVHYTVKWINKGAEYTEGNPTTDVIAGQKVETLPTAPTAVDGTAFMGWTAEQNITDGQAPTDLFKTAEDAPTVDADVVYKAVYAQEGEGESITVFALSNDAPANGNKVLIAGKKDDKYFALQVEGSTVSAIELTMNNDIVSNTNVAEYTWTASEQTVSEKTGIAFAVGSKNPLHINSKEVKCASGYTNGTFEFTADATNGGFQMKSNQNSRWLKFDNSKFTYSESAVGGIYFFKETELPGEKIYTNYSFTNVAPIKDITVTPSVEEAETYWDAFTVTLDCETSDVEIRYTLDGSDPKESETVYSSAIEISGSNETITLRAIATDGNDNWSKEVTKEYTFGPIFSSLEDLAAADLESNTIVKVTFENVPIKSIFVTQQGYRNGIYFDIQKGGKDIEIYYQNVPNEWVAGGKVSGTMICPWKYYSDGGFWELAPENKTWSWSNLTYVAPTTVTIASSGYSSFSSTYAVTIPEGVTAYYATGVEGNKVSMIEVEGGVIPANEGVIIKGVASQEYTFIETVSDKTFNDNKLVAVSERIEGLAPEVTVDDVTYKNYVFSGGQFHPFTSGATVSVGAGKAYLQVEKPSDPNAKLEMSFGDVTGIESLIPTLSKGKGVYNLQGVRVNNGYKGIVIMNGKKYINK